MSNVPSRLLLCLRQATPPMYCIELLRSGLAATVQVQSMYNCSDVISRFCRSLGGSACYSTASMRLGTKSESLVPRVCRQPSALSPPKLRYLSRRDMWGASGPRSLLERGDYRPQSSRITMLVVCYSRSSLLALAGGVQVGALLGIGCARGLGQG